MRIISLLLGLAIIAVLVGKQLDSDPPQAAMESIADESGVSVPKVPSSPDAVQGFEQDINAFMQDTNTHRNNELDEMLGH